MSEVEARRGLTFRQRRQMGLTFRNMLRVAKQLKEAGELDGLNQNEIAIVVMESLVEENPKAFAEVGIDWDGILDFIERLIPLIMRLIDVFS